MHKTTESKVKRCEKCEGTGKIKIGNLREIHNHDVESCPYCFGDGSLIKVTTIEFFRKSETLIEPLIPRP